MTISLDGRQFSPIANSEAGRVGSDAVFTFKQSGNAFTADYEGAGFSDGHLIGRLTGSEKATLVYHSRASDGSLEVGEASAIFSFNDDGAMEIAMTWRWLSGSKASGTSHYREIVNG